MTAREKAPDPSFGESLFQHMWDLWVQPEIERRGSPATQESLTRVVVEMAPDGPVVVKLEDEAGIEASVVANRALAEGEEVFVEDITNVKFIRPADIDPNNGWICFARMASGHAMLAFDFTYNKQRAAALLERAGQFLAAAEQAGQGSRQVAGGLDRPRQRAGRALSCSVGAGRTPQGGSLRVRDPDGERGAPESSAAHRRRDAGTRSGSFEGFS
jgi:hypothetical protein